MDKQQYEYRYEKAPANIGEVMHKDAMRYRRLKFFLDTLVVMDKKKGAMHFENSTDFDDYIDNLTIGNRPLTAKDIAAHALNILQDQFNMSSKENKV